MLDAVDMKQSMSRVGRCIDNGPMESFWGTLKCEKYYLRTYRTFDQLNSDIDDYIRFYNYERLQKKIKRPQSHGIQDKGRLTDFYFLYCLLDGVHFKGRQS